MNYNRRYLKPVLFSSVALCGVFLISMPVATAVAKAKGNPDKFILYNSFSFLVNLKNKNADSEEVSVDWWINRKKMNQQPVLDLRRQEVPLSVGKAVKLADAYLRTQPGYSRIGRVNNVVLTPIDGRSEADYYASKKNIWTSRYNYEVSFAEKGEILPIVVVVLVDGTVVKPDIPGLKD